MTGIGIALATGYGLATAGRSTSSINPTSMYCPPVVCLQCTLSVLAPTFSAARPAGVSPTVSYRVVYPGAFAASTPLM
jgi:hypothetical protein